MNNPKVSVIIPAYNAERYLPQLIDSVISQDEHSWELILVNDGSMDSTPTICEDYAQKDERIIVIHQTNQGLSAARNAGIEVAKGEWIAFIDADDMITDTYLSAMLSAVGDNKRIDLVYCSYAIVCNRSILMMCKNEAYVGDNEVHEAFCNTSILQRCCAWARMYRRSIIIENNIRYDTKVATEDRTFNYDYMQYIQGIATTGSIGYLYGSFSSSSLKHKKHHIESYVRRQTELTRLAESLCSKFDIEGSGFAIVWNNAMLFLKETMESVYYHNGKGKKSENLQLEILHQCVDEPLLDKLKKNTQWLASFKNDKMLQLILSEKFEEYNRKLWLDDITLSIKQWIHGVFKNKTVEGSYEDYVRGINRTI